MKYMTFRSSCSYAALANLLSYHGIDTEDRAIALQMRLPYLFDKEDGQYLSGPMLQCAKWFRIYLSPLGFTLKEYQLSRGEAVPFLRENLPAMLGLRVTPDRRHAVVCTAFQGEEIIFLNNKHRQSGEPDMIHLTEHDFLSCLDETVTIGVLKRTEPEYIDLRPYLEKSLTVLQFLQTDITGFCSREQLPAAQQKAMNNLFRPILLDGVSMLELLEEEEIASSLRTVRSQLLDAVKENCPVVLSDQLDLSILTTAMSEYARRIAAEMDKLSL